MSEYQRYEFMTIDRPLTRAQLGEVEGLSSHIKANSTSAYIEYHWGDFKHDPIDVLYQYFDGFLYWANWGSPHFALRFPHGVLPGDLLHNYNCGEEVTFTLHTDYDILDFNFGEMEPPDGWIEYTLTDLIPIREELINGDLRALYIGWLASQEILYNYDYDGEDEEEDDSDDQSEMRGTPEVPPNFKKLTPAQLTLADLLQVPSELLAAAALHSKNENSQKARDDFKAWVDLLPPEHQKDYLLRLALNESGLHIRLVKELHALGQTETRGSTAGETVPYRTLLAESREIEASIEREENERLQRERHRRLQNIRDHQANYWNDVDRAALKKNSSGYDEAVRVLEEIREAASYFDQNNDFQQRFRNWILPYLRRPGLINRLRDRDFPLPKS